jgi:hypothetical protein
MQTAGEKAEKDHILGGGPTTNLRMQMLAPNTAGDAKIGTMGGRENAIRDRGDGGRHGKRGGRGAGSPNNGHSQDGATQAAEMARRGPTHAGVENPTPGGMRVRGADPQGRHRPERKPARARPTIHVRAAPKTTGGLGAGGTTAQNGRNRACATYMQSRPMGPAQLYSPPNRSIGGLYSCI